MHCQGAGRGHCSGTWVFGLPPGRLLPSTPRVTRSWGAACNPPRHRHRPRPRRRLSRHQGPDPAWAGGQREEGRARLSSSGDCGSFGCSRGSGAASRSAASEWIHQERGCEGQARYHPPSGARVTHGMDRGKTARASRRAEGQTVSPGPPSAVMTQPRDEVITRETCAQRWRHYQRQDRPFLPRRDQQLDRQSARRSALPARPAQQERGGPAHRRLPARRTRPGRPVANVCLRRRGGQ